MKTWLFCLALPWVLYGATEVLSPPVATFQKSDILTIQTVSPELTTVSLRSPEFVTQEILLNGESRKAVTLEGEPFCPQTGFPSVPQITRLYRIPNMGGVELVVRNADYETLDSYKAFPYYDAENETAKMGDQFSRNEWWPPRVAEVSAPMIFRDFRVVAVTMYPVQVNAATDQARFYSAIDVDLVSNNDAGENELLNPRALSPSFVPMYRHLISNLDEDELSSVNRLPGTYMIICRDNQSLNPWVDSLATWRRLSGYEVIIERQMTWSASQMQAAIQETYASSLVPLEYVALMGDPAAQFGVPTHQTEFDHYFALGNSDDDLEDFGVGRYPCSSSAELAAVWRKLVLYEREPAMEDSLWFRRAVLSASYARGLASNAVWANWADQQFQYHTGLDSNVVLLHPGAFPNAPLCELYQRGLGYFIWRGSWIGEITPQLPSQCITSTKLPVCAFFACGEDVIAKAFVLAGTPTSPKGGTAAIGVATAGSHAVYNITSAGGLVYSMANMHVDHLGHALNAAKVWLFATYGMNTATVNHARWTNLVGDPALSLWTDVPATITVEHPAELPIGASSVTLMVKDSVTEAPIADAVVVLWKGSFETPETYIRAITDADGYVTLPVSVTSAGDMRLCVTKHNHKPYLLNIPCAAIDYNVAAEELFLDDNNLGGTHGNGDEHFNAGETVDLLALAHNFGTLANTTPFAATISCDREDVSFENSTVQFPALDAGASSVSDAAFRIVLSPSVPNETTLKFTVTFDLPVGETEYVYEYFCISPEIAFAEQRDPELFLPGSSQQINLSLRNTGTIDMPAVHAELFSLSHFVHVEQASCTYGNIDAGETTSMFSTFRVRVDSGAFRGQTAPMMISIVDGNEFRDTVMFEVSLGTLTEDDPSGPDRYGYYAFDYGDTSYTNCPIFEYLEISNGLGVDLDLHDPGEDEVHDVSYSRVMTLPFAFKYYGIDYDTLTVCANGWLAFGDQGWNDNFRNYPIPGINGAANMVAPYWDELKTNDTGKGVWAYYDEANGQYLVQWKATAGGISYSDAELDFQVVLYDPQSHHTRDENGMIEFRYNDVTMNLNGSGFEAFNGSTVGIQDAGSVRGLQYCFGASYAEAAAVIEDSTVIRFTTDGPLAVDTITTVNPEPALPTQLSLHQNYPNPFNPSTTVAFELVSASRVNVSVFDLQGRKVETLIDNVLEAGLHSVKFDGAAHASGVYFCRMATPLAAQTIKMVLLK